MELVIQGIHPDDISMLVIISLEVHEIYIYSVIHRNQYVSYHSVS